jgi:hypothetical protein
MPDKPPLNPEANEPENAADAMSIVQRGNLKTLEKTLRKQWRLGQNIVLCWSSDERGLLVILVPHYYLGNYCAQGEEQGAADPDNETFVRELISGQRRKTREELFAISERLNISPTFIKLSTALAEEPGVISAVEQLIKRYGLSYVESRAVLLFDIVEFSLYTPFEQASQLNSLSYSLNSAYNKLLGQGIEINFARTTTGDGYYVWNRDLGPSANQDLFYFLLLVVADNAVARAASKGNTVPLIRAAYHIGGHYELYQAEGVNPSVFSYIVGDVTIELARMIDLAQAGQILVGDFRCDPVGRGAGEIRPVSRVATSAFVSGCNRELGTMAGLQLSGESVTALACHLTENDDPEGQAGPRRFLIIDKHGLSRHAYNLQIDIELEDRKLSLGLENSALPQRGDSPSETNPDTGTVDAAPSAEQLFDDLSLMLKKRQSKKIIED